MPRNRYLLRLALIFAVLLLVHTGAQAHQGASNVGFQKLEIPNGNEPPLDLGVWYPTDAPVVSGGTEPFEQGIAASGAPVKGRNLPLVVISHGGGGSFVSHYDTAVALARAGFVVAAISHRGDSGADQSQVLKLWRRPAQLQRAITYMLQAWPDHARLNPQKIGAFGFSNGGFTVLVAAGGVPDLGKTGDYCHANPTHDLCQAIKNGGASAATIFNDVPPHAWIADPRIKAIVVAAPAFGYAFDKAGLENVRVPVQLWGAANDQHQPRPWFEDVVRNALPTPPEYHLVPGAGHYDFLPPCSAHLASIVPSICVDPAGFDRAAFHRMFNAEVVTFFQETLNAAHR
ncbi:dienelactone hydrolase [Dyella dinghuensis]|uniref:Dienelactone hydrolase n=1 Tax=Dyella dinghuensis TaxID=1920169 RepID=A0A432LS69_9GAMM|nr:prolyl oligopeptidase family serine peptidase [Dyella dinghuensis]RUL63272.1 dienelactone hydrolase [Dyella dinghuensis]